MLLSICYPSYNRGELAYEKVEELLAAPECKDIQIVVSNNGSIENTEGYERIAAIRDERLKYFAFADNHQYWGNVHQVIRLADGDFCLLLSDEDHVVPQNLHYYTEYLEAHREDLAVMKAKGFNYSYDKTEYFPVGIEAIKKFYLVGNYLSGVIYNKRFATEDMLKRNEEIYIRHGNIAYLVYPHMMIEAELLTLGGFACGGWQLVREGESVPTDYFKDMTQTYASVENRLTQMRGFFAQFYELQISDEVLMVMLQRLIEKTMLLCVNVKGAYEKKGIDWNTQLDQIQEAMRSLIEGAFIPLLWNNRTLILQYVDLVVNHYRG